MSTDPQLAEECDALRETIARGRRWATRLADFAADAPDAATRAQALELSIAIRQAVNDAQASLEAAETPETAPRVPRQRVVLSSLQGARHG